MTREQAVRRGILADLGDSHPFLIPEQSLFAGVNLRLPEAVTKIEFQAALRELEGQKRILGIPQEEEDPITHRPHMKWRITDNGLARLAELNG